jgi:hypothetical protein
MADMSLPAHLQKAQLPRLSDRATEGMGSAMPPHVSIRGNEFTLIDKSGEERSIDTKFFDCCILDISDVMCKLYYGKDWTEDSKDPPVCWSSNGIAPSREAITPQSQTCQACPQNIRGSAISKLSGASIKACRDEKWLAILYLEYHEERAQGQAAPSKMWWTMPHNDLILQFRVTPGSFVNWKSYAEKFSKQPFDIADVVTRLQFEKGKNGVLTFTPVNYINPEVATLRNKLVTSKATDGIVGRLDQPIQGQLAAPLKSAEAQTPLIPTTAEQRGPKKRGPKPKEAATSPAAGENGGPAMAPFRPEAAPTFGIEQPAAPPAELANDLDAFFKS